MLIPKIFAGYWYEGGETHTNNRTDSSSEGAERKTRPSPTCVPVHVICRMASKGKSNMFIAAFYIWLRLIRAAPKSKKKKKKKQKVKSLDPFLTGYKNCGTKKVWKGRNNF